METRRAHSPLAPRQSNAPPPAPVLLDELIMEILSWLPVKPLLQFRCVCKSWKSLISDPKFVKFHLQRSPRNASLLLYWAFWDRASQRFEESDLNATPCPVRSLLENPSSAIAGDDCYRIEDKKCYYVVGSCNGLVCLLGFVIGFKEYWFCLWNPATRLRSEQLGRVRVDHNRTTTRFAFGYDNLSDTYKVVAFHLDIEANDEAHKTHVEVYSMGDNCWRNIQSFPSVPFVVRHYQEHNGGVYLSGTLNWLALNFISVDYKWNNTITIDQLVIVSLDLGLETYTQLLLPRGLDEAPQVEPTLGVLVECLCFSHDYKRTHFVVWQMKEFGVEKSWTQFVKVSYQDLQIDCLDDFPLLLLWMSENGDILIMARAGDLHAILYNRRDNRVERSQLPKYIGWADTKDYVESLVLPYCN